MQEHEILTIARAVHYLLDLPLAERGEPPGLSLALGLVFKVLREHVSLYRLRDLHIAELEPLRIEDRHVPELGRAHRPRRYVAYHVPRQGCIGGLGLIARAVVCGVRRHHGCRDVCGVQLGHHGLRGRIHDVRNGIARLPDIEGSLRGSLFKPWPFGHRAPDSRIYLLIDTVRLNERLEHVRIDARTADEPHVPDPLVHHHGIEIYLELAPEALYVLDRGAVLIETGDRLLYTAIVFLIIVAVLTGLPPYLASLVHCAGDGRRFGLSGQGDIEIDIGEHDAVGGV